MVIDNSSNSVGGMEISFIRHVRLLIDFIEVIPVSVCLETDDNNYQGKLYYYSKEGIRGYSILISDDFQSEKNDLLYSCVTHFLIDIAKIEQIDGIQIYGAYQLLPFSCGLAANYLNIPYIISFRGSDFNVRIYHSQFNHLIKSIELASICTFVNTESLNQFLNLFPAIKAKLIYNYTNVSDFVIF
ncbi:MAG: hypothetical protein A2309_02065 [Bacteroidetes bacterium RIFOXYB2_FULL_35_7]|nr:MAG: hypothetical protein A2309_02065 [Bacteroidetes bacterium RIFOXYB2_FULL_35_7]